MDEDIEGGQQRGNIAPEPEESHLLRHPPRLCLLDLNLPDGSGMELRFLAANADVKVGDLMATSGLDGVYPPGLPVAKVTAVERRGDTSFARVSLQPVAQADSARHVLILQPLAQFESARAEAAGAAASEAADTAAVRASKKAEKAEARAAKQAAAASAAASPGASR